MKSFMRRIAVVIGAVALSAGLLGATAVPAQAGGHQVAPSDSSWPGS